MLFAMRVVCIGAAPKGLVNTWLVGIGIIAIGQNVMSLLQ